MQPTRRAVLTALAEGPVAGPELADRLEVSRATVWKHIEALRAEGFEIVSDGGGGGYELVSIPEFGAGAAEFGLEAPFEVEYHDTIGSTNERARELATEGRDEVVVLADRQTGGRGRLDRTWDSPSGGIWLSVVLRPDVPPTRAPAFTFAAAVATARAVRTTGVGARIKWPNDVLVETDDGERKLAGILTEMEGETDRVAWLVVGIGINANVDPAALPPGATSIRAETGDVNRRALVQALLEEFQTLRTEPAAVVPAWRELATTLGRRVRVETPDGDVTGEAVDVSDSGTLVVDTGSERVEVVAGDCRHLRPEDGP